MVLKQMLTIKIFEKRNAEEIQILRLVLCGKESSEGSKGNGKEILMNTLNICTINFDLPVTALAGEVFFACGALVLLANYLDLSSIFWLSPMIILLLIALMSTAQRLKNYGLEVIQKTKEKIRWLDNTVSCSTEISTLRNWEGAINLYNESASCLNKTVSTQIYLTSRIQIYAESFAIASIFGLVVLWEVGLVSMEPAGVASALAVISRLLPTVTRSMSSMTQLQYGIPAIYRLERFLRGL
jgi:ABC-type multidrug transport system fused ATPase/permease subunit